MADKMAEKQKHSTAVLMILCGIPASGKTYLANCIKEWNRSCKEDEFHVLHICYDDLIPSNLDLKASSLIGQNGTWDPMIFIRVLAAQLGNIEN